MPNVIEFPNGHARIWVGIERALRPFLAASGHGKDTSDQIFERLEERFFSVIENRHNIVFPDEWEPPLRLLMAALVEMLDLEVTLYWVKAG